MEVLKSQNAKILTLDPKKPECHTNHKCALDGQLTILFVWANI